MDKYDKLFDEWMDLTEFTLVKYEDGWGLHDNQGANLGDIESDRFKNARQVFDRMDACIDDYIIRDLIFCFEEVNDYTHNYPENFNRRVLSDWLILRDKMPDNQFEMNLIDMICNHPDEINLENCYYENKCIGG